MKFMKKLLLFHSTQIQPHKTSLLRSQTTIHLNT